VTITLSSAGSSGSPNTLPVTNGSSSNGRNRVVIYNDGGDLGATAYVQLTPNDAEKIIYIRNSLSGSRDIIVFQGTYSTSNDYVVPNGTTAVVFFNGAGTGAVAANVFNNAVFDALQLGTSDISVDKILDQDDMSGNDASALATQQSIKAYVDSQVATVDTLSEVLANGNTTGGTSLVVSSGDDVTFTGASANIVFDSSDSALEFADNAKAIFGAGSDLQIFHDGSNSYVKENGTGNLWVTSNGTSVGFGNNDLSELYAVFNNDGEAKLFFNGVQKFATSSTGIDVTGTAVTDGLTVDGTATITTADNTAQLTLVSTDADASVGPLLTMSRASGSPADNDAIGELTFNFNNDAAESTVGTRWRNFIIDASDGTEDVAFDIFSMKAGALTSIINYDSSTLVFNDGSADIDFRVESNNNANMLYVDGGNDRVAIGTNTQSAVLTIEGAGNNFSTGAIALKGAGVSDTSFITSANGTFFISQAGTSDDFVIKSSELIINDGSVDRDFRVESDNNTHMLFVDAGNDRVGIAEGSPTHPLHVQGVSNDTIDETKGTTKFEGSGGNGLIIGTIASSPYSTYLQSGYVIDTSTAVYPLSLNPIGGGVIVNENGADANFRVESDNNANMLFVDAGNDHVNIGTSSDFGGVLNVNGGGVFDDATTLDPDTMGTGRLGIGQIADGGGFAAPGFCIAGTGGDTAAVVGAGGNMYLGTGDGTNENSLKTRLLLNAGEAVFNDESLNTDFRVESDSDSHALFVDAGNNQVMVGASGAPTSRKFYVESNLYPAMFRATNASINYATLMLRTAYATGGQTATQVDFRNGADASVGTIKSTVNSTAYNTSSDARLKENIADADDAGKLIDAIQVRQFDWIEDGEHQRYGMVAQELNTVAPEAVSEGETEDDMMGVDYSKLVPMLVKEIQSLRARVAQLESN
jgi:hypothetical protein